MTPLTSPPFSLPLQKKLETLAQRRTKVKLGSVDFDSPLLLAPMSSICKAPFRLLMEDLGAGGTVSELISATGIFYKNQQTLDMLYIDPREKNVGLQIFGDDADHMNFAALVAQEKGAKFVDINMGCPVRKVVTKGAGSALLREPLALAPYLQTIKKGLKIPLTIKIRTGWCSQNAEEVLKVAEGEGVEFVAVHGRTREQQYRGKADWDYLEKLATSSALPIIGNGDLHSPALLRERLSLTRCPSLMVGRGSLRNPFIFSEAYAEPGPEPLFKGEDYFEAIQRFHHYLQQDQSVDNERKLLVQFRKMVLWFSAGFPHAVKFRGSIFQIDSLPDVLNITQDFFLSLGAQRKAIDPQEAFMNGGHG